MATARLPETAAYSPLSIRSFPRRHNSSPLPSFLPSCLPSFFLRDKTNSTPTPSSLYSHSLYSHSLTHSLDSHPPRLTLPSLSLISSFCTATTHTHTGILNTIELQYGHRSFPAQTLANPGQISIYGHPSPTNSNTNTPANNSPTSPHLASATVLLPPQSRQIRPPKAPLYVPAVLRPTERPSRHQTSTTPTARDPSPITPPRSVHGSLDSLNEDLAPVEYKTKFHSRNNTVSKVAEDAWKKGERLGEVTGVPTRDHWKVSFVFAIFACTIAFFVLFEKGCKTETLPQARLYMSSGVTV